MTEQSDRGTTAGATDRSPADRRKQESRKLLEQYSRTKDRSVRDRLVELNADLVKFVASRFSGRGEPIEDIEQVGFLGLIHAIERFDPALENEFSTFATPTIMGEIRRHFRDKSWALRVPRRLQENYGRVVRARETLRSALAREPTVEEIGASLELESADVLAALEVAPAQHALSLSAPREFEGDSDDEGLAGKLGARDDNLDRVELSTILEQVMSHLTSRERQIMALRFVDQLPQTEVARRLGMSQMHVSRLQRAAIDELRRQFAHSGVSSEDLSDA